jgi:hypothetical protein
MRKRHVQGLVGCALAGSAELGWAPTDLSFAQEAGRCALWSLVSDLALSWVHFLRWWAL